MKTYLAVLVACFALPSVSAATAQSSPRPGSPPSQRAHQPAARQTAAIEAVLRSYERSLNAGDVEGVAKLYTDDAVLLAPNAPSAVGIKAVRAAYTATFRTIELDLTFKIAEVTVVSPGWAFLRSTSHGVVTILANGAQMPSSNHELFVLHKSQGRWKLARYSFASALPAT
jgi:uncharacterized protein (TIGR02246 family)